MIDLTEQDYILLSSYLDRELPLQARQQVEQRLAVEPALAEGLASLQALQSNLQDGYRCLDDAPLPERVVAMLQPSPARIVQLPHRRVVGWGFAMAASLVVAVSATLVTQWGEPVQPGNIDATLAFTLENSPSTATGWETLSDGRNVRPVLSFLSHSGNWCREYLVADAKGGWHGVACRQDSGWSTTVIAGTSLPAGSADEYRPAGAMDSTQVAGFIDANAADIPLDANQEARLIASKWQ